MWFDPFPEHGEEARHIERKHGVGLADDLAARIGHVERMISGDARTSL